MIRTYWTQQYWLYSPTALRFVYITAKTRRFRVRLAGFINQKFFCKYQMAKTNVKTPCFRRNVNEPLKYWQSDWNWTQKYLSKLQIRSVLENGFPRIQQLFLFCQEWTWQINLKPSKLSPKIYWTVCLEIATSYYC